MTGIERIPVRRPWAKSSMSGPGDSLAVTFAFLRSSGVALWRRLLRQISPIVPSMPGIAAIDSVLAGCGRRSRRRRAGTRANAAAVSRRRPLPRAQPPHFARTGRGDRDRCCSRPRSEPRASRVSPDHRENGIAGKGQLARRRFREGRAAFQMLVEPQRHRHRGLGREAVIEMRRPRIPQRLVRNERVGAVDIVHPAVEIVRRTAMQDGTTDERSVTLEAERVPEELDIP